MIVVVCILDRVITAIDIGDYNTCNCKRFGLMVFLQSTDIWILTTSGYVSIDISHSQSLTMDKYFSLYLPKIYIFMSLPYSIHYKRIKITKVKIARNVQNTYTNSVSIGQHGPLESRGGIRCHGGVSIPCLPVTSAASPRYIVSGKK